MSNRHPSNNDKDNVNGGWGRAEAPSHRWMMFDRGMKIAQTLVLLLLIPAGRWMFTVETRIRTIEGARWLTDAEGAALRLELADKVDREDVPPVWFQAEVQELKDDIGTVMRLLMSHMEDHNGGQP